MTSVQPQPPSSSIQQQQQPEVDDEQVVKTKGLSRLPVIRKLVSKLVDSATLKLATVQTVTPTPDNGLAATVAVKVSELGTGPLPLNCKLKFLGPVELWWPQASGSSTGNAANLIPGTNRASQAGQRIAKFVTLEPLKLTPSGPGASSGQTSFQLDSSLEAAIGVGKLVNLLLRTPAQESVTILLKASGVTVKAYGFTFKALHLEKEIKLGGLGGLGGVVKFPSLNDERIAGPSTPPKLSSQPTKSFFGGRIRSKSQSVQQSSTPSSDGSNSILVQDLEITGGHPTQGIFLSATATLPLDPPSKGYPDMVINLDDLTLDLCVAGDDGGVTTVGELTLARSAIKTGKTSVAVKGRLCIPPDLQAGSSAGRACGNIFTSLLQNQSIELLARARGTEVGQSSTSSAAWLSHGFNGAEISAILPPLGDKARLLDGAQLRAGSGDVTSPPALASSFDLQLSPTSSRSHRSNSLGSSNGSGGDSSTVRATLRNGFGAEIAIHQLQVRATDQGSTEAQDLELGVINTPDDWPGLTIRPGDYQPVSLPFELNSDSSVLIRLLKSSAAKQGVDLGSAFTEALDLMVGECNSPPQQQQQAVQSGDTPEDFADLITKGLSNLLVAAYITVPRISIGGYEIPGGVEFVQESLAITIPASTAAWILPRVGAPLVARLVEGGNIKVTSIDIKELDESGIFAQAGLTLSGFGPLYAEVSFGEQGLAMLWEEGEKKGQTAAIFFFEKPLVIEPARDSDLRRQIRICPVRGAQGASNFVTFIGDLLQSRSSVWRLDSASVQVNTGGAEFHSTLSKTITLDSFGGFPLLKADRFDILGEELMPPTVAAELGMTSLDGKAVSFKATVSFPNPGNLSLNLSQLDLELFMGTTTVGRATSYNVSLPRGQHVTIEVTGFVHEVADVDALGALATDLLASKPIRLGVRGRSALLESVGPSSHDSVLSRRRANSSMSRRSSTSHGSGHRVAWLDAALRELSTTVDIQHALVDVVRQIEVENLQASFPLEGAPAVSLGGLVINYEVPFPVDVAIESVTADIELLLDGKLVGTGSAQDVVVLDAQEKAGTRRRRTSSTESRIENASGRLKLALNHFTLDTNSRGFADLIQHVFVCQEADRISLRGHANVVARTVLGRIPVRVDLGNTHKLRVKGMRSLSTSPTDYTGLQVVDGTREHLKVTFDLFLNNPSENVEFILPDSGLSFAALYRGAFVGRAFVGGKSGPFKLTSGPAAFRNVDFLYYPKESEEKAVRQLPANFLSGMTTKLEIRGDEESTTIAALRPALSSLSMTFDLKPLVDRTLIASISIALGAKMLTSSSVECEFVIANPLQVPIDLTSLSFTANYKGKPFGSSALQWPEGQPLRVPPGQEETGQCLVRLAQRLDQLVKAFLMERGTIYLQVDLSAGVEMGGYRIPVFEYVQERLPLHIKNLSAVSKLLWAIPGV